MKYFTPIKKGEGCRAMLKGGHKKNFAVVLTWDIEVLEIYNYENRLISRHLYPRR